MSASNRAWKRLCRAALLRWRWRLRAREARWACFRQRWCRTPTKMGRCWGFTCSPTTSPSANRPRKRCARAPLHFGAATRRIQHLAGKLIAAQEEERKRVARELHDDINQKLATLAITLSKMKQGLDPAEGVHDQVTELQRRTTELTDDVRRLSHRLHPGHHGARRFGRGTEVLLHAIQQQRGDFDSDECSRGFEACLDVALCLYRVTQESLQNISKHSGAREACVTLTQADGDLRCHYRRHHDAVLERARCRSAAEKENRESQKSSS